MPCFANVFVNLLWQGFPGTPGRPGMDGLPGIQGLKGKHIDTHFFI